MSVEIRTWTLRGDLVGTEREALVDHPDKVEG
jgi:hypothetical protein